VFSEEDVLDAIKMCNFEKAIGEDGFDGRIFKLVEGIDRKVAKDLAQKLNNGTLPQFMTKGRLVPCQRKRCGCNI